MERISDKEIDNIMESIAYLEEVEPGINIKIDREDLSNIIKELKERRATEATSKQSLPVEPLDIKGQLRLVRDRCPDVWREMALKGVHLCPRVFGLKDKRCICGDCKECWDEALEGED